MDLYADLPQASGSKNVPKEKIPSSVGSWAQARHAQMLAARRNVPSSSNVHRTVALKTQLDKTSELKEKII